MLISAEVTSNLGRFDGIRYGLQEDMKWIKDLHEYYTKIRMEWFWNEVKKRILLGNYVVTKENYEMLAYLIMRYKGFDFFQRKKETLIDYNERLKTYILCDEFIRSKKCL